MVASDFFLSQQFVHDNYGPKGADGNGSGIAGSVEKATLKKIKRIAVPDPEIEFLRLWRAGSAGI